MVIKEIKRISETQINFIYKLRNNLHVRNACLNKKKINFKTHIIWLENFKKNKNKFYLIKENKKNIGYIRLEKNNFFFNVSWALNKNYNGKGYMTKSLQDVTNSPINNISKFKAFILKENIASIKVAIKSGFKRKNTEKDFYIYCKTLQMKKT